MQSKPVQKANTPWAKGAVDTLPLSAPAAQEILVSSAQQKPLFSHTWSPRESDCDGFITVSPLYPQPSLLEGSGGLSAIKGLPRLDVPHLFKELILWRQQVFVSSPTAGPRVISISSIFQMAAPGAPRDYVGPSLMKDSKGRVEKLTFCSLTAVAEQVGLTTLQGRQCQVTEKSRFIVYFQLLFSPSPSAMNCA